MTESTQVGTLPLHEARESAGSVLMLNTENAKIAGLLLDHIEKQTRASDSKAQFTIGAATLLAAALTLSNLGVTPTFPTAVTLHDGLVALVSTLLLGALIVSVYFALLSVRPTLSVRGRRARSLFFFGDITELSEDEFIGAFAQQSDADNQDAILAQVYAKSIIAQKKYARVRNSINALFAALILWTLLQAALIFVPK